MKKFEHGVMMLRVELMSFYKSYHKDHPMEDLTRLSNLSMKMLGTPSQPKLKTKGMETWGILLFCVAMLHEHSGKMQADYKPLVEAGECLVEHVRIMKSNGYKLSPATQQRLATTLLRHVALIKPYVPMLPKHHLWVHMIKKSLLQGNPWKYANFLNESLNKNLKNCCKHASQLTFETTVLWKATEAIPQALGRKRKYDFGS